MNGELQAQYTEFMLKTLSCSLRHSQDEFTKGNELCQAASYLNYIVKNIQVYFEHPTKGNNWAYYALDSVFESMEKTCAHRPEEYPGSGTEQ